MNLTTKKLNNKGQGLVEYLILVALMGVATIGVLRILQGSLSSQFANVVNSVNGNGGKKKVSSPTLETRHYKTKDFSNFIDGTKSNKK